MLMRDAEERSYKRHKAKQHSTPKAVTFPKKNELPRVGSILYVYIHVLMRDEKEGRKKQARSNKQQGKATQHMY